MTNPTLNLSEQMMVFSHPAAEIIDLSLIQNNDRLIINTRNTHYSFRIINNQILLGELSKTNHGEAIEAVLIGAFINQSKQITTMRSKLKIQAQALFLVLQNNRFIELVTSEVVGISLFTNATPKGEAMEDATMRSHN
jgi:hypothetical protein